MSFLDIAASAASNSLTLFVGTGLSKHLTDNNAPSWLELIVECAEALENDTLISELFIKDKNGKAIKSNLELTVCAQIIELEFKKQNMDIRDKIAEIINSRINDTTVNIEKVEEFRKFINLNKNINIITTNYDSLLSEYIIKGKRRVVIEGLPIARTNGEVSIYHIHGSVVKPQSIILTMNDYFEFQHKENYFSRKLFTLLRETQVVILGYSLSDFNLNRILNEAKNNVGMSLRQSNIYYVSRDKVDNVLKQFYLSCYGVEIIENCNVSKFINGVVDSFDTAKRVIVDKAPRLQNMLNGQSMYVKEAIKTKGLLERFILRASLIGTSTDNKAFQQFLVRLVKEKKYLTIENGAWDQYTHFAEWLINIGSFISIKGSFMEDEYLEFVRYSWENMSKQLYFGSAWAAFVVWDSQWENLLPENRKLILNSFEIDDFSNRTGVSHLFKKYNK